MNYPVPVPQAGDWPTARQLSYTATPSCLRFWVATSGSRLLGARFDQFQLDLSSGKLLRSGTPVPIQDQPFQVLRLLLEAEGGVVTREQLRTALWPKDTFVDFERGVNTAVKKVRQALEDSAENPKFVETLPKIGYRFIAPVEWVAKAASKHALHSVVPIAPPGPMPVLQPISPKSRWKLISAIVLFVVAVTATVFLANQTRYMSRTRLEGLLRRVVVGRRSGPLPAVSQRRLTANPDDAPLTAGVISPDGKYLAYSDSTGLYVRQVEGGETHSIPLPKGFDALPESWFPDSVHLVVTRLDKAAEDPPSLWAISMMGGTPRKLADQGSSARVSPDGSQIAFLKGMWDYEQIWLADADGNSARKILDGGNDRFGPTAWAPDGKQFAYVKMFEHSASRQIGVYDVTKGQSETILTDPGLGLEIAWVNPRRLIYSLPEAQPNQGDSNLWWVELDARTGHPSGSPTRITSDRDTIASISVTSDGKRMALVRSASQADVYLTEVEAQGRGLSTPRRFTLDERQDFPATWTPDSKAVLIVSDRDGPLHIFKQNVDQTQPELLVGGKQDVWLPRLTPDGLTLLYLVRPAPGEPADNGRLMRIPFSGGPSQLVLEGPGIVNYQCARLPSTVCMYGQIDAEYYRFFTFDPSGGKGAELSAAKVRKEEGLNNWNLSPDGKYLASCKSQNPYEVTELRIFSLTDNSQRYIPVSDVRVVVGIDWAADSKSVWVGGFMGRGSWGTRSGLTNVDLTGKVKVLLKGHNPAVMGGTPSPDGHRLALGANTESSNAWLLENF